MNLPFVSREAFLVMRDARDYERQTVTLLRAELADLRAQYHALRLHGAEAPHPRAVPVAKADLVTKAIVLMSRGSSVLRKQFLAYVTEQRAAGESEENIAAAIAMGIPDDEGLPG